jgi:iron complex outermembrane receptor protein
LIGLLAIGLLVGFVPGEARPSEPPSATDTAPTNDPNRILDLDIDQLANVDVVAPSLNMEVSTVERTESTVGKTPAAVFVITNEMIRRSGVRTVPDALRLAPGVDVAQIDASKWAVSIRGFNGRYANKLLVQIDGRSVYSPLYGGVFWDVQDMVLEDVERIEVIRGPGGTLWGANAVNGVINIISKGAKETQGGYFEIGGGTEQRNFSAARYGGQLGDNAHYRLYGKWFDRDGGFTPDGSAADDWRQARTGFRIDWTPQACDTFTLQGDYYKGVDGEESILAGALPPDFTNVFVQDQPVAGGNVVFRWTHVLDKETDWSLQAYYDRTERSDEATPFFENRDTVDLDFQYRFPLAADHAFIWGAGYRNTRDRTGGAPFSVEFDPDGRADDVFSLFAQDQITLREDLLYLILGSKFEHNDYTGFEYQPTARVLCTPDQKHCLWGAISRAVRTPTEAEFDVRAINPPREILPGPVPVFPSLVGRDGLESETLLAYEVGMRAQPTDAFYWDLTLFYNDYADLTALVPQTPVPGVTPAGWPALYLPLYPATMLSGETYGFELAAGYQLTKRWNLRGSYSLFRMMIEDEPGVISWFNAGENPCNQSSLWLSGDLGNHWNLDLIGRYVDSLPALSVPSYLVMDVRLAWRPRPRLEMFVAGRNLLAGSHLEFTTTSAAGVAPTEVQEEVYGGLVYRF